MAIILRRIRVTSVHPTKLIHFTSLIWRWFLIQLSTNWVFYHMLNATYFYFILLGIDICIYHIHIYVYIYPFSIIYCLCVCMHWCSVHCTANNPCILSTTDRMNYLDVNLLYSTYFSLRFLYKIGITPFRLEIKCKFVYFKSYVLFAFTFLLISFQIMIKLLFSIMRVCHFAVVKCKSKYSLYFICIYRVSYMGF